MPEQAPPRVFLCHATEDKERFALPFATALRANGANAWIDTWEIKAGDSLVTRIFTEGLGTADAVIPILSPTSITKPWVQAELDVAIVRKINGQTRLMPLLLELPKEDVPVALQATSWITVANPTNLDAAVDEALRAIFNTDDAPPLGSRPTYATPTIHIPGLTPIDQAVLFSCCTTARDEDVLLINPDAPQAQAAARGITEAAFHEAVHSLEHHHYLSAQRGPFGGHLQMITLHPKAIETFLQATMPNYTALAKRITAQIANSPDGPHGSSASLAAEFETSPWVTHHLLRTLESQRMIKTQPNYDGTETLYIYWVSPLLRRTLE